MRKFSKILESADSNIVLSIKNILIEFKDIGFEITITEFQGNYTITLVMPDQSTSELDMMECIKDLGVADDRLRHLGMSYEAGTTQINKKTAEIRLMYKMEGMVSNKDIHGWKEFKSYCEKVLGIDGIQGADTFDLYFRINVVDKDAGWSGIPDDMAGWSIGIEGIDPNRFAAAFPGYEGFIKKLLDRQINYSLVWHLCGTGQGVHISDPVKLEEEKKTHNPMRFDKEGIEAIETLFEMSKKFPDKIEIIKHEI